MKIFLSMIIMTFIITMMLLLTIKLSKKNKMSREKNSSFECGFTSISQSRKSFSIHFFMVAMIFLIFDMEISIILPMMSTKLSNLKEWTINTTIIMMILNMGLINEWKFGMLEWKN